MPVDVKAHFHFLLFMRLFPFSQAASVAILLTTELFVGFGTDRLRREEAMNTAGRENPNHGVAVPRNRAHGAVGQNRSCSIKWAAKQEKLQPKVMYFFLTSPFIELLRWKDLGVTGNQPIRTGVQIYDAAHFDATPPRDIRVLSHRGIWREGDNYGNGRWSEGQFDGDYERCSTD
jgi:hypothetical protein